jgi:cytochrome c oxidase cbb3-type subunit 3
LHGGTPDKILETLNKGRTGNMPPMAAAVGTPDDVRNVASTCSACRAARTTPSRPHWARPSLRPVRACHGADGKGNQAVGAPNLTDDIWLHGAELAKLRALAVREQLKALGVTEDQVELKKPGNIDAGASAEARRVEVSLG